MSNLVTPQNGPELFSFYRYHLPRMDDKSAMPVVKKGMAMLLAEYDRLCEVEKAYNELKSNRAMGRPLGRPPKDGKDE
jgi:hypothetical protein